MRIRRCLPRPILVGRSHDLLEWCAILVGIGDQHIMIGAGADPIRIAVGDRCWLLIEDHFDCELGGAPVGLSIMTAVEGIDGPRFLLQIRGVADVPYANSFR